MRNPSNALAAGRHYVAIPGPSVMPDRVLQAMHRPAPNIYDPGLSQLVAGIVEDLKAVARTQHEVAIYIGNGHAAWEASLCNVISPGDHVLVMATGHFGHGWGRMAEQIGAEVTVECFATGQAIDPARVSTLLRADADRQIKALLVVQTDTSTSVRSDIAAVRAAMDSVDHPALLMVDCIACLACDDFEMDAWGVDVMVTGCQKGLMTPPGLGFVFFNDRADAMRDQATRVTGYWDWRPRARPEGLYQYFCGTAPTHHLFGLREALTMLVHEEGLDAALARHAALAQAIWAAVDRWGQGGPIRLTVNDPALRSHAVTSLQIGPPHGTALRDWMSTQAGVTLGIGLGMATEEDPHADGAFRIGHMGHVNAQMVMGALGAMEAGMRALDIPFAEGGLSVAAERLSRLA